MTVTSNPVPAQNEPAAAPAKPTERCVAVVDRDLPPGRAANAAAVLALTLGARVDGLVGADLIDADGVAHPGLIPIGLPILTAPAADLAQIRERAVAADLGVTVIDFPSQGQETNDYDEFRERVAEVPTSRLEYVGLALHGPRKSVNKLVGNLPLLR